MELLANKYRPSKLEDIVGQRHLVSPGKVLYNMIKNEKVFSMILYGKPGIGKTTIANVIVNSIKIDNVFLNATSSSKNDFERVIEEAKMFGNKLVIIDEIHRMNKDKQDILLPYLESGLIILIGLTTSNPYHSINPAIRSRCQVFELKEIDNKDIITGLRRIIKNENISIDEDSLAFIAASCGGDFRSAINLLDVANSCSSNHNITLDELKELHTKPVIFSDKDQDGHYDLLSAFQKSIRGSNVDAALYYLGRLIEVGDLDSIYRRMSVIAYEDIGLANPLIGPKVMAAISACELVGMPEGRIPLSTVICEMALSPKSNSAHVALDIALNDIRSGDTGEIPDTIKINSKIYKYPHDYPGCYVEQQYLPTKIKNKRFYHAKPNKYEDGLNRSLEERIMYNKKMSNK